MQYDVTTPIRSPEQVCKLVVHRLPVLLLLLLLLAGLLGLLLLAPGLGPNRVSPGSVSLSDLST